MKAILMHGELFMGVLSVEEALPELRLPVSKRLEVLMEQPPTPSDTVSIRLTFRIVSHGPKYLVYQLDGWE